MKEKRREVKERKDGEKARVKEMGERRKEGAKEGRRVRREERRGLGRGWRRWRREGADLWFWGPL